MAEGGQTLLLSFLFTFLIANAAGQFDASRYVECTEGSRWRIDDCNWCSCISGVGSCIIRSCPLVKQNPNEAECDGISRWKEHFAGACSQCDCRSGKKYCHPIACASSVNGGSAVVITSSSEIVRRDFTCTALSRWRQNCNWCRCGSDRTGRCMNRYCVPGEQDPNERECEGNSEWKEHRADGTCNKCECKYGKRFCFSVLCSSGVTIGKSLAGPESHELTRIDYECTSNSRWRDNCNWCRCGLNGIGICTKRACIPGKQDPFEPECEANSEWKERRGAVCTKCECKFQKRECYSISCATGVNIGKSYFSGASSGKYYLGRVNIGKSLAFPASNEISRKDLECTAGSRWRDKCNWCRCGLDGTGLCLFGACYPGVTAPLEPECEGNSEWTEIRSGLCTKCECKFGKRNCYSVSCSTRNRIGKSLVVPASNEIARKDFECTSGSLWRDDCNWCRCAFDGTGICVFGACVPGKVGPFEPECEGVSEWKEYKAGGVCTKCECRAGKRFCYAISCASRVSVVVSPIAPEFNEISRRDYECNPGSRWRDECNWCRCALDRTGICSRKACIPGTFDPLEPQCEGVSEWKERKPDGTCRTCECKGGISHCRSISCSSGVAVGKNLLVPEYNEVNRKDFTCTQGSHWRDQCNWCRCALDSTGICNSQYCRPGVTFLDQCIGNSSWRKYKNGQCSACECRNDKAYCNPVLC